MDENSGSIWWIIAFVIALLQLPFVIHRYLGLLQKLQQKLHRIFSNYNNKEKITIATAVPSIVLAGVLYYLTFAQLDNSIPALIYMQTLPANSIPEAFPDLMWFGVLSGILCSFLATFLLKVHWKELRIVLSEKSF